ncbi:hypothetical protein BX600DRAFT_106606 [Xylariales sp. PMI_506]|nr:hypothetical protein BX600DRAFT_106606 [Xylariales sp. PMI_506]
MGAAASIPSLQQGIPFAIRQVAKLAKIKLHVLVSEMSEDSTPSEGGGSQDGAEAAATTNGVNGGKDKSGSSSSSDETGTEADDSDSGGVVLPRRKLVMRSMLSGLGMFGAAPLRAVGIPTEKREEHILDGSEFTRDEPVVGKFLGRMRLVEMRRFLAESGPNADDYLRGGWEEPKGSEGSEGEGEGEVKGDETAYVIRSSIWSVKPGAHEPWRSEQVWGFQDGRYTGRLVMIKGEKREVGRLVYDYVPN